MSYSKTHQNWSDIKYILSATRRDDESFPGKHEDDIPTLEKLTDRSIQIYTNVLNDQSELLDELSRHSSMKRTLKTSLLRYENHISWTADVNRFLKKFRCYVCDQFFDKYFNLMRHMRNCSKNTHHKYPTGAYQLLESIFARLEDIEIFISQELRLFSHLIVFAFKSITFPEKTLRNTDLTSWTEKQIWLNISNLTHIAETSTLLMREKLNYFVLEIEEKYSAARQLVPVNYTQGPTSTANIFENKAEPDEEETKELKLGDWKVS